MDMNMSLEPSKIEIPRNVCVRAYDLGGFGDIAAAVRMNSYLNSQGISAYLFPGSDSAIKKIEVLVPGADIKSSIFDSDIVLDIAGFYLDPRSMPGDLVPHHFTEDMDNSLDHRMYVPSYMKTGLQQSSVSGDVGKYPLFYRPYMERELLKLGERDVIKLVTETFTHRNIYSRDIERILSCFDGIGFAHLSPQKENSEKIFEYPYFRAVKESSISHGRSLALGLFVQKSLEDQLVVMANSSGFGVIRSDGSVSEKPHNPPYVIFMGNQPQVVTSNLFLSATIPNLVTGDLSLSDALYALIAMDGPAFFYECPSWKVPTFNGLIKIFKEECGRLTSLFIEGSVAPNYGASSERGGCSDPQSHTPIDIAEIAYIFTDPSKRQEYDRFMRKALRSEIVKRFGSVETEGNFRNGYYIQPGAPYLIQDATTLVVRNLIRDSKSLENINLQRSIIKNKGDPTKSRFYEMNKRYLRDWSKDLSLESLI